MSYPSEEKRLSTEELLQALGQYQLPMHLRSKPTRNQSLYIKELLSFYCQSIIRESGQNLATLLPAFNTELSIEIERLKNSLSGLKTSTCLIAEIIKLAQASLSALTSFLAAMNAQHLATVIIAYFKLRRFVENNLFPKRVASTVRRLLDAAQAWSIRFNGAIVPNKLTRTELFYQLWTKLLYPNSDNLFSTSLIKSLLGKEFINMHFHREAASFINKNFVSKKYQTDSELVINFEKSFPCHESFKASIVGCHGVKESIWKKIQRPAGAWEAISEEVSKDNNSFLLSLGDAAYEFGPTSFAQLDAELASYNKLNQFFCLGNHEYSLCSHGAEKSAVNSVNIDDLYHKNNDQLCGFQRGLLAFSRCYLPENKEAIKDESYFISQMSNFHAPYRYYAVNFHQEKTVMIVLDSNLFAFDVAQQKWFAELLCKPNYSHYKKMLVMHHPFIDPGKRGEKTKEQDLELVKYQKFIQQWFVGMPPFDNDPRQPQMWVSEQNFNVNYEPKAYPTVGCFMSQFLMNNNLVEKLNNTTVFSAHFHGHVEYQFTLDGKTTLKQVIIGAGGANLAEAKSFALSSQKEIVLKNPDRWAFFGITNFEILSHGGLGVFDHADLNLSAIKQEYVIRLIQTSRHAKNRLPVVVKPTIHKRTYRL